MVIQAINHAMMRHLTLHSVAHDAPVATARACWSKNATTSGRDWHSFTSLAAYVPLKRASNSWLVDWNAACQQV
eukprot:scaffold1744_cov129-Isochrysis_galbana.AAC.10